MKPGRFVSTRVSLALAAVVLQGCSERTSTSFNDPIPASVNAASVQLPPSPQDDSYIASGPLVVENQVDVTAQREGIILRTIGEPGQRAKRNQLLAELDSRQISADLEAARAKTRSIEADLKNWEAEAKVLEADYRRAEKMWDAQILTKEQLEHARYKAESDKWDVKRVQELLVNAQDTERSLQLELEKTQIRAPFDGIVARRYVRTGQRVAVGDRLFWVTAEGPLRMKFTLPERFLGRVKRGEELWVTSPVVEAARHKARVIQLSPVVDPSSGTFDVMVELVAAAPDLHPGMTAAIRLTPRQ